MENRDAKEKAVFVVGLLAAFLAFSAFKEELGSIRIAFSDKSLSLLQLMMVMVVLLAMAVYFYALDYWRYGFGRFQNFWLFKPFYLMANFFYSLAILFPVLFLFLWIVSTEPIKGVLDRARTPIVVFDVITAIAGLVIGAMTAYVRFRYNKLELTRELESQRVSSLEKAIRLYEQKFYGETVIEVHKTLEQYIKERLLEEKDLSTRHLPMRKVVDLAADKGLLNGQQAASVRDIVGIRNNAAHTSIPIDKKQAEFALETVRAIIEGQA